MMKITASLLALLFPLFVSAQTYDVLIKNGRIIDGTGNAWFYGDLAISDGKIAAIAPNIHLPARRIIDAKHKIVCPGFIDAHTHIEGDELKNPTADNFIHDGVTTVITGNCGSSSLFIGKYLNWIDSLGLSVNVATLAGHNDIREAVMGKTNRKPTLTELNRMKELLDSAMAQGALGFSTGLIYIPGTYATTEEIQELATCCTKYNGIYATHLRNESDTVSGAIREALRIAKQAACAVEISHLKVGGQQNWGSAHLLLHIIDSARKEGIAVTIDQYPYTASSTSLGTLLPDEVMADGMDSVKKRLQHSVIRKQVLAYMLKKLRQRQLYHYSYAVVANYKADTSLNGKSIEAINLLKKRKHTAEEEAKTILEMISNGGASMVFHGMSEKDVQTIARYPQNMFASDAGIRVFGEGVPHPRGYGTRARVLNHFVKQLQLISWEEAIRRMTSLPAQTFRVSNRGLLLQGFAADVIIINPETVQDMSMYEHPHAYSKGIEYVWVNGELILENEKHTGKRAGKSIRRN